MRMILLLFLTPFMGFSQTKMSGLGKFKIDSISVSIISDISNEASVNIRASYSSMESANDDSYLDHKTSKILLLSKSNDRDKLGFLQHEDPSFIDNPDISIYFINSYSIAGVSLDQLYLFFYKDSLYKIKCRASNGLLDAIDFKYGKREIRKSEKIISCRTGLGISYNEKESSFFQSWKINNENLYCLAITSTFFDSKCEKLFVSIFEVYSKKTDTIIENAIKEKNKNKENNDLENKRIQLKDF